MLPAVEASSDADLSLEEVLAMLAMVIAVHVAAIARMTRFTDVVASWGDNSLYIDAAGVIRQWHFAGGPVPPVFFGYSAAIAAVTRLVPISPVSALMTVSIGSSVAVYVLLQRLYGGRVAAATLVFLNYQWILAFMEGGNESLFMCLLYACFLAARTNRWTLAALLAALATTVRPVGIVALVSLAAVLAMRKRYGQLAAITGVGLAIGALYFVAAQRVFGNPFVSFSVYQPEWVNGWPLTYPLGAVIPGFLAFPAGVRWTHHAMFLTWLAIGVVGGVAVWLPRNRQKASTYRAEALFTSLFVLFYLSYNSIPYAAKELPRFLLPVLPLILFFFRDWIPRHRGVLWASALLSALLSAAVVLRTEQLI